MRNNYITHLRRSTRARKLRRKSQRFPLFFHSHHSIRNPRHVLFIIAAVPQKVIILSSSLESCYSCRWRKWERQRSIDYLCYLICNNPLPKLVFLKEVQTQRQQGNKSIKGPTSCISCLWMGQPPMEMFQSV